MLYDGYSNYQKEIHNLDVYKDITVYDKMIVPNIELITYMVEPIMIFTPSEYESLFSLLDGTDSRITIDEKFCGAYTRALEQDISQDMASQYFVVMDDNLCESPINYNDIPDNNENRVYDFKDDKIDGR